MTLRRTRRLDIYIVIKELRKEHSEYSLCQLCMIGHVNRGAYYKWMNNPDSQNDALNKRIADKIMEIHGEHPDMGYRRIRDTLAHDHDINVSDKRVLRICRKKRVQSIIRHRYNCCTKPAADPVYIAENVLNREFHADHLNEKWVTDVSEFKYGAGNIMYAATVMTILLYSIHSIKHLKLIPERNRFFIPIAGTNIHLKNSARRS